MFALLQKSYETKQYKKGLKAADTILKKFPDHGGRNFLFWYLFLGDFPFWSGDLYLCVCCSLLLVDRNLINEGVDVELHGSQV